MMPRLYILDYAMPLSACRRAAAAEPFLHGAIDAIYAIDYCHA